jgi:cytochrome o ubiquinol oxidase subunit 1
MGMTRRMQHYDNPAWQPWLEVAAIGAGIIFIGIVCQVVQLVVSIRNREQLRVTGDPWNGRTLEWSIASPPPAWNFAVLPQVTDRDAWWVRKQRAGTEQAQLPLHYEPLEMPKNSPVGFVNAFFSFVTGFALVWHIWWLAALGLAGILVAVAIFAFRDDDETEVPVEAIIQFDQAHSTEATI